MLFTTSGTNYNTLIWPWVLEKEECKDSDKSRYVLREGPAYPLVIFEATEKEVACLLHGQEFIVGEKYGGFCTIEPCTYRNVPAYKVTDWHQFWFVGKNSGVTRKELDKWTNDQLQKTPQVEMAC